LFCAGSVNDIDASGVDALQSLLETLQGQGIELYLSAVKKQVWDVLEKAGMIETIGRDRLFATDREAVLRLGAEVQLASSR
jgi:SulP family sulfate permease